MNIFVEKIKLAIEKYDMITPNIGESVCVGLSGGADSVSLLLGLHELRDELGINLSAIHVNHKLRGITSYQD